MNKDEILEFWLSLCPDNMDRECCAQYLKHDVSIPDECLYTINRIGNIWYASNEKRRLANHNEHYGNFSDENCMNFVDEIHYFFLRDDIEKKVVDFIKEIKPELLAKRDSYYFPKRYDDIKYPTIAEETINNVINIIEREKYTYIHYVGYCDVNLAKALYELKEIKLTLTDYFERHYSRGYAFDEDMNLYENKSPEPMGKIRKYSEGMPWIMDTLVFDAPLWGKRTDHILTNDTRPYRPSSIIQIDKGKDSNQHHHFYEWEEVGTVIYGKVKKEHSLYNTKDNPNLAKIDKHMRGES